MNVLITGATGLVGKALLEHFSLKGNVYAISRRKRTYDKENIHSVVWDYSDPNTLVPLIKKCQYVIHLAGENIGGGLWTSSFKQKLVDSRVHSTQALCEAIEKSENRSLHFIQASAVGFYGFSHSAPKTESSEKGKGFLADLCDAWENTSKKLTCNRSVIRLGIVLSEHASLIQKTKTPTLLGLGAILGNGKNGISWIHIDDVVGAVAHICSNSIFGNINCVSPNSVRSEVFYKSYAGVLNRKILLYIPKFLLAVVGKTMVEEFLLADHKVFPQVLLQHDYTFKFKTIESAFKEIFKR